MSARVTARLRRLVVRRAVGRCEYRGLAQEGQEAEFHVDHIIPVSAGGATTGENLALACVGCSLRKGARRRAVDPVTNRTVVIFHPRRQKWPQHFRWEGVQVVGKTAIGRATVEALLMNRLMLLTIRQEELLRGRQPPTHPGPSEASE